MDNVAGASAAELVPKNKKNMLAKRVASAAVMLAAGFGLVIVGGWVYTTGVCIILAVASWEFGRMFMQGGYHPSISILVISNILLAVSARSDNEGLFLFIFAASILITITYHVFAFRKAKSTSAVDLAATLSGLVFIGFLGSYFIRLRFLPQGLFWLILAIAPAGLADIGAFFIGSLLGSHKLAPALSPNKTIEGYIGGLFTAMIMGYASGVVVSLFDPYFTGLMGLLLGSVVGLLSPLGDLGKSLIKRQFNLKHTSNLIPGHGGMLDRVDTWLWAGVIGYYVITFIFLKNF